MAHALCTVRGLTGAVLALAPIHSESSKNVASVLESHFTAEQRAAVRHVATDDPSATMWSEFRSALPNL
eukprot:10996937-Alexandrium_andersonii.AAC.1